MQTEPVTQVFAEFIAALRREERRLEADVDVWSQTATAWVVRVLFHYEPPPNEVESAWLRATRSVHGDRRVRFDKGTLWTPATISRAIASAAPAGMPSPLL